MLKRLAFLLVLLALGLSAPARAGWAEARSAYEAGDHPTAFQEIRKQAGLGDPLAQFDVGIMYSVGRGVTKDEVEALKWYRLAAYRGLPEAQFVLALTHLIPSIFGQGSPEDPTEAKRWLLLAARQGLAEAQFYLAEALKQSGDTSEALNWYNAAAEQGFTSAQDALAEMYRSGPTTDDIEALKWYIVTSQDCRADVVEARQSRKPSRNVGPNDFSCLDLLSSRLTLEQMGEAIRLADQVRSRIDGVKVEPMGFELIFPERRH